VTLACALCNLHFKVKRFRPQLFLALVTMGALAPFLGKPFHIDDPLFLWIAQQITRHPLDPYGFTVAWGVTPEPIFATMQNPPLCSYFIGLVASVAGWSEIALHSAFLIVAVAAVLGTFALAHRLCQSPITASLLTLFTPTFLVSATNVMCDVMLLALWVWTVECWLAGLERERLWLLAVASLLAAAAVLTKYFGISVVPLLAVYTLVRKPRSWYYLAFLVIPVLITVAYEVLTRTVYGRGMFSGAVSFVHPFSNDWQLHATQLVIGLSFVGGCLLGAVFFAPCRQWRFLAASAAVLAIAAFVFYEFGLYPESAANRTAVWVEGALFIAVGLALLGLAVVDLIQRRSSDSLLLLIWVFGTFIFASFLNWAITARAILPMAPAISILVMRQFGPDLEVTRRGLIGVVCAAMISLIVAAGDYSLARVGRAAAGHFRSHFSAESHTVWFHGHWGFQYYMEQWGAKAITTESKTSLGDIIIIAESYPENLPVPLHKLIGGERVAFSSLPWVATLSGPAGAGFYCHALGPLPWVIDRVPPETFYVARLID
jgi:4-amino-4-deoxy-L-arabinose transferase-like glycosyltransferase